MNDVPNRIIRFGEFELDPARRRVLLNGSPVQLKAKAFELLIFLVENAGRVVSKEEILNTVWKESFVEEANLPVQISALRKALQDNKDRPRILATIPGKGYEFIADVQYRTGETAFRSEGPVFADEPEGPSGRKTGPPTGQRLTKRRVAIVISVAGLFVLIAYFGYRYSYNRPQPSVTSLAVLPFSNENKVPETEYLSDGLAESVIHSLSGISELRVMSRSSAFRYKGKEADAKTIGKALNVQAVLTGRILQVGDNLSVSTELVSVDDNSVIWGEQFTRKMSDIETLQSDIAKAISRKLRIKLSGADEEQMAKNRSEDPEAYRLLLLGRFHLNKLTDDGFRKGRDYFQQAIDRDPEYPPAYAGLASSYNRLSGYSVVPPTEGFPKAREAALKALALNEQLSDAHAELGAVKHFYDWDWSGAEREFKRAIELNPGNADARQLYGYHLAGRGRFGEALSQMRRAHELDPVSIDKIAGIGEVLYFQKKYDEAISQYQKALELDSNSGFARWALGNVYVQNGMYKEAITEYQKSIRLSGESTDEPASLGYVYALSGNKVHALNIIEELKERSKTSYVSPCAIAFIYIGLGEMDRAFEWLEKAYEGRDFVLTTLRVEPTFDRIRSDKRFEELLRRVGH